MLSSITSFLPSALQNINSNSHASPPPVVDDDDEDDEHDVKPGGAAPTRKKEKKEKGANETFIFVRPPPAKSNHPLNLQVQLVPPNSQTPGVTGSSTSTPRQSLDDAELAPPPSLLTHNQAGADTVGEPLARTSTTQSSRSEVSTYSSSGYTSTASFSSVGSTASGRRLIIPLYNLQAHNVMTNTIVDAGTDAKIARFTRKGLEMIDLAVMEVVEVWPTPSGAATSTNTNTTGARGSIDEGRTLQNRPSTIGTVPLRSRPTTPDPERLTPGSSVVSVSSAGLSATDEHHLPQNPTAVPIRVAPQKRNIFGKLFKKKDTSPSPEKTPTLPPTSIIPPSPTSLIKTPVQTPTHSVIPPSPTNSSRHGRNLSSSMTNFGKRGASASPSRPMTSTGGEGTGLGLRSLIKNARPSSMHLDPNDVQPRDFAYDNNDFGPKSQAATAALSTTSSRISTASKMSNNNTLEPPSMFVAATGGSSTSNAVILPATLGIQPTLSSPGGPIALSAFVNFTSSGYPPPKSMGFGRGPALYVWVIRKWIKTPEGTSGAGLFGGMKDAIGSMGANNNGSSMQSGRGMQMRMAGLSEIEVRVEWKRGKKSKSKKKVKDGAQDGDAEGSTSRGASNSRRQSIITNETSPMGSVSSLPAATSESSEVRKKRHRLSTASKASTNEDPDTTLTSFRLGRGRAKAQINDDDDDGNDSDPEDSETPWTCTLKARHLGVAGLPRSSPPPSTSTPIKVKIATLSPMPHHPKVVAMLKVPYPLPDLEVQTMSIRKRPIGLPGAPLNQRSDPGSPAMGLVFRAEEIKDVVCSTGIWVVVREGFGGVGKVSRKGDGWRIRA
ncbi:hypothetical protein C8J55DRAFT_463329 [Lentinula edodes]|uniref:Uncharacterized protein n=1 Tax=Lentinula lateritia TaxID=40482 RepID=A0A9W8ZSD6_9AGAR|nr:hypothetical protein C8J55DRAFT_463329 [Lentinula edodes]